MDKIILHCDNNNFFASVETILNPKLAGVPMAVAGDPKLRGGIILSKNELAKKCGVKTAETIWEAKRKCPGLVCVPPTRGVYHEYYEKCNEIYNRFTDLVEPMGIDESYLDVTGSRHLFGDGKAMADKIRQTIREELGLTISVGVSFCKVFAKLGSDTAGPDSTLVITRETGKKIVFPLPASALWGVGKQAVKTLEKLRINTIGELARYNREILISHLGEMGGVIHDYANGKDDSLVMPFGYEREVQSIGNGRTFEIDVSGFSNLYPRVFKIADSVGWRLRNKGFKANTIQVAIKDPSFKTIQRQKKLDAPINTTRDIVKTAMEIIKGNWHDGKPVRSITITASNLVPSDHTGLQMSFFEDDIKRVKAEKIQETLDRLNEKWGRGRVGFGTLFKGGD